MLTTLLIVVMLNTEGNLRWEARAVPSMDHCAKFIERAASRFPSQAKMLCVQVEPFNEGERHKGEYESLPPQGSQKKFNT